jgi:hypothetical protein
VSLVPPNNSLKLTRRAGPSGLLVLPAGQAENPASLARFRRAASCREHRTA